MNIHKSVTLDRVVDLCESSDMLGLCLTCGAENNAVEPDASEYMCETCREFTVWGVEELLLILS